MIDELKVMLDALQNVPEVTLWILGGFLLYKLVTYLSVTGSVVYVIKLICDTLIQYSQKDKISKRLVKFHEMLISEEAEIELTELLKTIRSRNPKLIYVHLSDIGELRYAWQTYIATKATNKTANTTTDTTTK